VPIGRDADEGVEPVSTDAGPPSAQSFWTEDSASLHAALQGTDPWTSPPAAEAPASAPPSRPRRALLAGVGVIVAVAAALIAVVVVVANGLGSGHGSAEPPRATSESSLSARGNDLGVIARVKEGRSRTRPVETRSRARPVESRSRPRLAVPARSGRTRTIRHSSRRYARARATPPAPAAPAATGSVVSYEHQPATSSVRTSTAAASVVHTSASSTTTPADTTPPAPNPASLLGPGHCACG
jgi:hypothetical protein